MTDEQKEKIIRFRGMGRGYAAIGKELGIPKDTVKSFCRRNGLTSADVVATDDKDRCRECGVGIEQRTKMKKQVFCCKACREKWWTEHPERIRQKAVYEFTCAKCGKAFTAYGNKKRKYCSHLFSGLLFCGDCKESMYWRVNRYKGVAKTHFICSTRNSGQGFTRT